MKDKIPSLTPEQMAEVDRIMIQDFNISLLQMMENDAKIITEITIDLFRPKKVTVLVGKGNNGGGGLAAARHIHNKGIKVEIVSSTNKLNGTSLHQLKPLKVLGINISGKISQKPDLFIDALLGYNAKREPYGRIKEIIEEANKLDVPVLSNDVPSGFDLTTGNFFKTSFKNATVLTLGLPKTNMMENIKELYLGDIGIPREVYEKLNFKIPILFSDKDYVKI